MARKAYSEEDRVQVRNALMTTMIQCIADRGLIHSSIDVLCRKVGISKTFFYSFFSSKEELVLYALRYQQPKLLDYARSLMEDPGLSWRAGVETFLKNCCYETAYPYHYIRLIVTGISDTKKALVFLKQHFGDSSFQQTKDRLKELPLLIYSGLDTGTAPLENSLDRWGLMYEKQ